MILNFVTRELTLSNGGVGRCPSLRRGVVDHSVGCLLGHHKDGSGDEET